MKNVYPRVGEIRDRKPQGLCKICKCNKSDKEVHVEVDYFRGNDEVYKVHSSCIKGHNSEGLLNLLGVQ